MEPLRVVSPLYDIEELEGAETCLELVTGKDFPQERVGNLKFND